MRNRASKTNPISGRRPRDASHCEMMRLGRVTPSAGLDAIDRKACFLSLLAQAAVRASVPGPACDLETFGRPNGGVGRPWPNECRTAGSGDPGRTSAKRRGQETLAERDSWTVIMREGSSRGQKSAERS